ncbi:hypothetical protein CPC08DRAFT_683670 [Agrocybe pediades]|nr:hypothetical protein CPC08DRAFT_683670 [Agrocybe pediades]
MSPEFPPRALTLAPSRQSHLYSHTVITNALRLLWVVVVIWGDLGSFFWSLSACRWPRVDIGHKLKNEPATSHVLLVADPQVQHSALLAPGSWWANPIRRIIFELNLRKSWHVTSRLKPRAIIFLGDMLANGKAARNLKEYQQAADYFKSIFSVDRDTAVYYIPGNNDVGLGYGPAVSRNLRSYFTQSFGPLNQRISISNHTVIALDAPGLVDEDYQRHAKFKSYDNWTPIPGGPINFVKETEEYGPTNVILLSHIPMSRPETADCGPLREKGGIRRGAGAGYQTMLGKQTTAFLLKNLEPVVIFSADNRDSCEHIHVVPGTRVDGSARGNGIREVTVKSFAMSVHIKRPGFQLLSLVDPALVANPSYSSYADTQCLLPDQYGIYSGFYFPLLAVTLVILIILNFRRRSSKSHRKPDALRITPSPRSTAQNSPNGSTLHPDPAQWSGVWSPFSPSIPTSPRAALPTYLRTPHTQSHSTTHLVASLPGTPTLLSPSTTHIPLPQSLEDEDEDTMYPAQYAVRRDSHSLRARDEDDWSQVGHHDGTEDNKFVVVHDQESGLPNPVSTPRLHSQFISAPEHSSKHRRSSSIAKRRNYSWSYTFVFRGRRRRITLGLPSWNSIHNLLDLLGLNKPSLYGARSRQTGVKAILLDALSVFWPSIIVWIIINWTIL